MGRGCRGGERGLKPGLGRTLKRAAVITAGGNNRHKVVITGAPVIATQACFSALARSVPDNILASRLLFRSLPLAARPLLILVPDHIAIIVDQHRNDHAASRTAESAKAHFGHCVHMLFVLVACDPVFAQLI